MDQYTLERIGNQAITNARTNQAAARDGASILALRDTELAQGDAALVIAAGPSLHRQNTAQLIKQSGFRGPIIATESAMAWCLRNDIVPQLVVTVDPHGSRIVRWFGDPALDEAAIARDDYFARQDMDPKFRFNQLKINHELLTLLNRHGPAMRICVATSAAPAVVRRCAETQMTVYWWNPLLDDYDRPDSLTRKIRALNGKPCINAGGNVGTACWVIAHAVLGKRKIGILGMDLSYYGETTYRETQYYTELKEMLGENRLGEAFVHIKNPYLGAEFFTDPAYYWYRMAFLEMAEEVVATGVTTYNCTGGGILFGPGVEFVPFSTFVEATQSSA
ncbi:MAG TPA: 6-hydroxymethylpterin diphosphokinase MptE-like protein [Stellaceae bacterium]|nr:6-hydroxymethylpterin diphosphokinase MptE-like protein [Stellaceae bacterium]